MTHSDDTATATNRIRQAAVVVAAVIAVGGAAVGGGAFGGTPISEAAGGALDTDATLVAPGGPAFAIWFVIYVGLVGYAILQALPSYAADPRQRRIGWWVAASMVLNAAWILSVQADLLVVSCAVIAALVAVLSVVYVRTSDLPIARSGASSQVERVIVDGTTGLYLGWASIATIANIAATLAADDIVPLGIDPAAWAVIVLVLGGLVGVGLAIRGRGRVSAVIGLCWGLAWIATERLSGTPESIAAAVAALTALGACVVVVLVLKAPGTPALRPPQASS